MQGISLVAPITLLATVVVIYIVLGIHYESFIYPITILSGLPAAGAGALLTLMLFKMTLDLDAGIGATSAPIVIDVRPAGVFCNLSELK